ncbi:hypothetical protein Bca52824_094244 [Brassica carinata]|uniref:Uncharacterized protein n=1 Tax=Brassica carinata TaxID=52824 RepID=A0A8X7TJA9_BRACI|nr:hypothetical protein Bca52824_094244 [Brassica carinata]
MGVERGSGKGLKQMLKRCSSLGKKSNVHVNSNGVPKGHFVVYVGLSRSRHIIPISFLTHPIFQAFTDRRIQGPALQIPILNLKPVFDSQSDLTYRFNSGINLDLIAWWCVETKNTVQGMRKKQKSCVLSPVEKK